jgi:hypothetical protein
VRRQQRQPSSIGTFGQGASAFTVSTVKTSIHRRPQQCRPPGTQRRAPGAANQSAWLPTRVAATVVKKRRSRDADVGSQRSEMDDPDYGENPQHDVERDVRPQQRHGEQRQPRS